MATSFLAATTGQPPLAQHVNQFLTTHPTQYIWTGVNFSNVTTTGATFTGTNNLWLAQTFSMPAINHGLNYVQIPLSTTSTSGSTLSTTTVSIYSTSGGLPTGSALSSTTVTAEYANLASGANNNTFITIPIPTLGLSALGMYAIVVKGTTSSGQYTWFRSAAGANASTSPDGVTWTAQAYGLRYQVFDNTVAAPLVATWEDSGQMWQVPGYNANIEVTSLGQYTGGQTAAGYNQGYRTMTYSNGLLQGTA